MPFPSRHVALVLVALSLGACTRATPEASSDGSSTASAGASTGPSTGVASGNVDRSLPPAPWSERPLARGDVPAVYRAEWQKAANRATCTLVAPRSLGEGAGAVPRAANFSGGWAVAYDRPGLRSAFGVAGTAAKPSDATYGEWPHERRWADGSSAGYGPEGGTGPNQLAYLRIAGKECLYNVWSRLGREHLEFLLEELRFVE
jgi:hypothetical protein